MAKTYARGATAKIGDALTLADCTNIDWSGVKVTSINDSTHSTVGPDVFEPGAVDMGSMAFDCNIGDGTQLASILALVGADGQALVITTKNTKTYTAASAFLESFDPIKAPSDGGGKQVYHCAFKISGNVVAGSSGT